MLLVSFKHKVEKINMIPRLKRARRNAGNNSPILSFVFLLSISFPPPHPYPHPTPPPPPTSEKSIFQLLFTLGREKAVSN
jgi:hypothetical protein